MTTLMQNRRSYKKCDVGMEVQSLLFPVDEFTVKQAKAWAKKHHHLYGKVEKLGTGDYFHLPQRPTSDFQEGSIRTIEFGDSGIKAHVGCPKKGHRKSNPAYLWQNPIFRNPTDPGDDESPHYPFKRRAKLGPGPLQETNARAVKWDCQCDSYVCTCTGISDETVGRSKLIVTDPERKKAYNKMYREWRKTHPRGGRR